MCVVLVKTVLYNLYVAIDFNLFWVFQSMDSVTNKIRTTYIQYTGFSLASSTQQIIIVLISSILVFESSSFLFIKILLLLAVATFYQLDTERH